MFQLVGNSKKNRTVRLAPLPVMPNILATAYAAPAGGGKPGFGELSSSCGLTRPQRVDDAQLAVERHLAVIDPTGRWKKEGGWAG